MQQNLLKKWMIAGAIALSVFGAQAQQDPYYSQYMFNKLTANPGFTGNTAGDKMCATFLTKKQWQNFPGAPFSQNININAPLGKAHGIGFVIENNILGFEKRLNFALSYAYRLKLGSQQTLSIGASGGIYQAAVDGGKLKTLTSLTGGTPDPNVPTGQAVGMATDLGAGVYFTKQNLGSLNDFYIGLSSRHFTQPTINYAVGQGYNVFKLRNHIYLMAGADKPLANGSILQPSVMFRYDMTKWQLELNANYLMDNKIWVGGSYRNDSYRAEALVLQGGMMIKPNLKAGIAYDFTLNRLGPFRSNSMGSFELMVQYCFKVKFEDSGYKQYRDTRRMGGWRL